jgi:Protein of unknown function (DUF1501)
MLTIFQHGMAGRRDGLTRRGFLQAGALAIGGLTLADVLRCRAAADRSNKGRPKSVIMVYLSGGPSHLDMYDMKPQAPREYRGEFSPISTKVPGLDICELMPMQAKIADKFAILRGCQLANLHTGNAFYSGYAWQESPRASVPGEAQRPAFGSVVSRLRPSSRGVPTYVSMDNPADWERAYYLGLEHEPFRVGGGGSPEEFQNMGRRRQMSVARLETRNDLLVQFDRFRRDVYENGTMKGVDAFQGRALEIVTSGKVRAAFDLEKEPHHVRARYGEGAFPDGTRPGRSLLLARRLVEAGVGVVTQCLSGWDTHRDNFSTLRGSLPPLDRALYGLISDLDERGLLSEVAVLMGGEFGRTPRIGDVTPDGRGHWPEAGFLWLAGGGLKTGQIIGQTDARGEKIVGSPIQIQNVLATLYHVLGIDPATTLRDYRGRPQYVLDRREPIAGLI